MLVVKVILVLCFTVFREVVIGSWALLVILYGAGLTWLFLMMRDLPFVHPGINGMQAGFASTFLWATTVYTMHAYGNFGDLSILFYSGLFLSYCLGFLAAYTRQIFLSTIPLEQCTRVVHLDVWARYRMQEYAADQLQSGTAGLTISRNSEGRRSKGDESTGRKLKDPFG